jgi:CRISPR-associated protein (TIGR03984 family)
MSALPKSTHTGGTLHRWRQADVTLPDAIGWARPATGDDATVIALSASSVVLGLIAADGTVTNETGDPVSLDGCFEARMFSAAGELRWLHRNAGRGVAVVVSETTHPLGVAESEDYQASLGPITYLVWGTGNGASQSGWSQTHQARVGSRWYPTAGLADGERLELHAVEYIGRGEHGNAIILEERLCGLRVREGKP